MKKAAEQKETPQYWQQTDKSVKRLKAEFSKLLDQNMTEQNYQLFMEENTRLVPREFVQNHGIHSSLVLRKLGFGADYKSDFVYLSKSSDDWNCVLIEIERPGAKFFKTGTNDLHPDFLKALQQINKWRAWFNSAANKSSFAESTVGLIRVPLERTIISAQEKDDFKILTFDSLLESLESKNDLYLGVRKNEYIDLRSDAFLSESIFAWMPPDQIRVGTKFRANALKMRAQWCHFKPCGGKVMDVALAQVRRRPKKKKAS